MDRRLNEQSILKNIDTTPYVGFAEFESFAELRCGFSTRLGGISRGIFSSMNLGFCRGDMQENVLENYHRICESIGICEKDLVFTDQVHDTVVRVTGKQDLGKGLIRERDYAGVDGHITNEPGVPLLVFGADCVPLFFYDPVKKVIGVAHAGWKGTAHKIAAVTVQQMSLVYKSQPEDIHVVIGPSIGPDCYEVGEDVASVFRKAFPKDEVYTSRTDSEEKYMLDLWKSNRIVLCEAGVKKEHIAVSGLCTMCHQELFFSHRATAGKRGSMAGFLMLKES